MDNDREQLTLLSIFHYIVAGIIGLFSCFPIFHLVLGLAMLFGAFGPGPDAPPPVIGLFFAGFAGIFMVLGWSLAVVTAVSGYFLAKQRRRMFSLVVAGISTIFMPFGTILGVFTIVVLMRPSVRELYAANLPAPEPPEPEAANEDDTENDAADQD